MKRLFTALGLTFLLIFATPTTAKAPNSETSLGIFIPVKLLVDPSDHPPAPTLTPALIKTLTVSDGWHHDYNVSWYGPGFYGNRTACGLAYTTTILGVAHRSLPCGTLIEFSYNGRSAIVPVIDRGPYVDGRQWDLSGGLCIYLNHCFTGEIDWRLSK